MNVLLDTHVLIWSLENNPTLSDDARNAIIDGNNMVFVSRVGCIPCTTIKDKKISDSI
jgi:PIN domain nuclease of toxin-antitoxin system